MKITVIGGGIVGLAVARELHRSHPGSEIALLEKEMNFACHQSTHNSGVLHAGLYYKPGSLKAHLAVKGIRKMITFCEEHQVRHEICGKLVLATNIDEVERLKGLHKRGIENGLLGLRWVEKNEIKHIEPNAGGIAGLSVPEEGIVDYRSVCDALVSDNKLLGTNLFAGANVAKVINDNKKWILLGNFDEKRSDFIINCAGLHSDRMAKRSGENRDCRIVPFRGEYYRLKPSAEHLVRHLIYPVPDPVFPFLGVHFTRLIGGGIEAGPNAVLALSREGYTKFAINPVDVADAVFYPGLWNFVVKHKKMAWEEIKRSFSRRLFCKSLQRLVPALNESDLLPGGAGVRAQAMSPSGHLIQDFSFIDRPNALHVINAPSPAATASLALAEEIVKRVPNKISTNIKI